MSLFRHVISDQLKNGIVIGGCTFLVLILAAVSSCLGADIESMRREEQKRLESEIEKSQIKIQRLQAGLESQKEGIEKTKLQKKGILAELQDLDQRLLKMADKLRDLEHRMGEQKELIRAKEQELKAVQKKSEKVQQHMKKRIAAYYKLGKIDLINITFSTRTLPELLRFHDSFQTVIDYDQQLMVKFHQSIDELESAKEALTLEQGLLEEFIAQANLEEENILETRKSKATLLNRVKTQAALHEQAMDEIQKAKTDLSTALLAMRQKEKLFDQGFLLNKSSHQAPLSGTITSLFNQERTSQFGITRKTPGITISSPDGSKIHAIYAGKVIYSGYLKGYGNTVIIDHGYQYFTITSRIERILVSKDTNVKRNDIIGITGSTATILDDGLYFEIRYKDTPLDPLQWLDPENLKFEEGLTEKTLDNKS